MYGKIFESMYDGSLFGNWEAIVTFQQMIVICDSGGIVDITPQALAARTSIPLKHIKNGIEFLEQPDKHSRSPTEDGRRLIRIDNERSWGWQIVNHSYYRQLSSRQDKREKDRGRMAAKRLEAKETKGVAKSRKQSLVVADVAYADADAKCSTQDTKKNTTARSRPQLPPEFDDFKMVYPKRGGNQPWAKALKTINARLQDGATWTEILDGAGRYAAFCKSTGKLGTEFVLQAATFCGPEKHYLEPWDLPATKADVRLAHNVDAVSQFMERTNGS